MNDGIFCVILYTLYIFIFLGGWFRSEIVEVGWRERYILLILLLLLFTPLIHFSVSDLQFSILAICLPLLSGYLMISLTESEWFQVLISSIFIATSYNLLIELLMIDPVLVIFDERLLIGLIMSLLVGIFQFSLKIKWISSTLGLWLGFMYFIYKHSSQLHSLQLFSYYELVLLYVMYLCIALTHFVLLLFLRLIKKDRIPSKGIKQ